MHAVLHLQTHRLHPHCHHTFEERLIEPRLTGLLAHNHGPQLAMITHQHQLLGTHHDGNEALGLCGLCRLIDEYLGEAEALKTGVASAHTGRADDISCQQQLALCGAPELFVLFIVLRRQLAELLFQLLELAVLILVVVVVEVGGLVMKSEMLDRGANRFATLGRHTHHFEARFVDFFSEMIYGHVTGRCHEHLSLPHTREMVDNTCRRHGLARTRRPLNA
mmetsp:Transcript_58815/g.95037  ORF Transcript_58815/g.95037 Transcript_58815/m.95037 type:complete len:221 (+) Transcript_58815:2520-3182(+)